MGVYKCYNRLVLLTKAKKGGTMIATVIICIIIAIAVVFAARRAVRTFSGDGSCCGGKRTKKVKRTHVEDTDEANYPYATDVSIGGMTCERCSAAGFRPMRFTVIAPANMPECC